MDIEFHYYMTYLIAARAGFPPDDAFTIAYSSQYVDDNCIIFEVNKDSAEYYRNYISQTMNILKPKGKLFRIYPLFHFIPGDPQSKTALRRDGKMHWLNTTPNSDNANRIMGAAMASDNLYRFGIASHSFVDTWAHQNFIGYYDEFNSMTGVLEAATPNIGHGDAQHNPDWPALVWKDGRLLGPLARVDNRARFLEAASNLYVPYRKHIDPKIKKATLEMEIQGLLRDLDEVIGYRDQTNELKDSRIEKYCKLGTTRNYGEREIPGYDEYGWFEEAINEKIRGFRDVTDSKLVRWDPFTDVYTWKDKNNYKLSDWCKFQEAVRDHQDEAWAITDRSTFGNLDLKDL